MNDDAATSSGFFRRARAWLVGVPAPDAVARRHAPSVLVLCGVGAIALVLGELVRWYEGALRHDLAVASMRFTGAVVLAAAFFLVRGGRSEITEGKPRSRAVVLEFPSYEAALACYHSPDYQAAKALRQGKAEADIVVIEAFDGH